MIFPSGYHQPQPKVGAKHITDPTLAGMTGPNPGGCWELIDADQLLIQLLKHVSPDDPTDE